MPGEGSAQNLSSITQSLSGHITAELYPCNTASQLNSGGPAFSVLGGSTELLEFYTSQTHLPLALIHAKAF